MKTFDKWMEENKFTVVDESIGHEGMKQIYNDMKPKIEPKLRRVVTDFLRNYIRKSTPVMAYGDLHSVMPEHVNAAMSQILQDLSQELSGVLRKSRHERPEDDPEGWVQLPEE